MSFQLRQDCTDVELRAGDVTDWLHRLDLVFQCALEVLQSYVGFVNPKIKVKYWNHHLLFVIATEVVHSETVELSVLLKKNVTARMN